MKIQLNGSPHPVAEGTTLAGLIESVTGSVRGSAVAVDDEVIPRGAWAQTRLRDGQRIELITAVQGG